jgi:histidinol-phosphate aminotransferase
MSTAKRIIRPEIQALSAYHVMDASGLVKLDVMESPYRLPEWLAKEVGEVVANLELNRYPVPTATKLRGLIKQTMGVPAGCDVLLGNGSDECITYITTAIGKPGAVVLAPSPSFVIFQMAAMFQHLKFVGVPLNDDFSLDADKFVAAVKEHQPALTWIAYPTNPTGNAFKVADIERIIAAAPGLVVIDEAYQPFADGSFMPRLNEFDNVVVMRTVSKIGMAGMRLGYVAGKPEWISEFDKTRPPYNINVMTEAVAIKLLQHKEVLDAQARAILAEREVVASELRKLPQLTVYPSATNFVLARVAGEKGAAGKVFDSMKAAGVLIKNLSGGHPALENCLRITVGTPEENRAMLAALTAALR